MPHRLISPFPQRRRRLLLTLLGTATLPFPLSALAGFNFFTNEYSASRDELQALVTKYFPLQQRYAELFTVELREPQLSLDAANNRVAISALLSIASPLLAQQSVEGVVTVSSALKYDATARALRLDQPQADRIELQGLSGRSAERLQQIGGLVAQELLRDQPLRTFKPEELTFGRKTYAIDEIRVQDDGITLRLK